jgi:hypothetical protein
MTVIDQARPTAELERRDGLLVVPPGATVPEGYGVFNDMDHTGHTQLAWDPDNPDEVEAARTFFDKLRGKGYAATRRAPGERHGETVHEFDPAARELTMQPAIAGG